MMSENELLLAYRDQITEETLHQLLSITELKLVQSGEEKQLRKRIFNILVECLQNIVNHAAKGKSGDDQASILLLGRHESDFFIITGNKISNESIDALTAKINDINDMKREDIREIYSDQLGKSEYSAKGGAGLGLLDIYKRSGRKLNYQIQPIDDEVSFLSLHITVDSNS